MMNPQIVVGFWHPERGWTVSVIFQDEMEADEVYLGRARPLDIASSPAALKVAYPDRGYARLAYRG
jgi:hypothetical protein